MGESAQADLRTSTLAVSVGVVVTLLAVAVSEPAGLVVALLAAVVAAWSVKGPSVWERRAGRLTILMFGGGFAAVVGLRSGYSGLGTLVGVVLVAALLRADTLTSLRVVSRLGGSAGVAVLFAGQAADRVLPAVVATLTSWAVWIVVTVLITDAQWQARSVARPELERAPRPSWLRSAARRAALPVALALVLGVVAALVLPVRPGASMPDAGSSAWPPPSEPGAMVGQRGEGSYVGGGLDLRARGELPSTEVMAVPADSPAHWRTDVLATYTGTAWYASEGEPDGHVGEPTTDYQVVPLTGFSGTAAAPGELVDVTPRGVTQRYGHLILYPSQTPFTVSVVPQPDLADAGSRTVPTPGGVDDPSNPVWVALPGGVSARTVGLAHQLVGDTTDPLVAARAIEDELSGGGYDYDLDAPVAPIGQDSVDYFLFDSKQGFCEHFASAEVVLLRSLGIPSRVAVGYSGGQVDGDQRTIRASDGHAGVEVFGDGAGCVRSDPTPGDTPSAWLSDPAHQRLIGIVIAVLAVLVGIGIWWWLRRRQQHPLTGTRSERDPMVFALKRLSVALQEAGRPWDATRTLAELAAELPDLQGPLALAERHFYRGRPVPRQSLREAVEAIDDASARILADAARAKAGASAR